MFKNWYIRTTNAYFVSHDKAVLDHDGPYTRLEATKAALWRQNNALRDGKKVEHLVIHKSDVADTQYSIGRW